MIALLIAFLLIAVGHFFLYFAMLTHDRDLLWRARGFTLVALVFVFAGMIVFVHASTLFYPELDKLLKGLLA